MILIVDDNELMRNALRVLMQAQFPEQIVHQAVDGASALAFVRSNRPQLVLMDIGLPDANGIELAAEIQRGFPETRVILVTQFDDPHYIEHARAVGAFAYVVKDNLHRDLPSAARRALLAKSDREGMR